MSAWEGRYPVDDGSDMVAKGEQIGPPLASWRRPRDKSDYLLQRERGIWRQVQLARLTPAERSSSQFCTLWLAGRYSRLHALIIVSAAKGRVNPGAIEGFLR